MMAGVLVVLLPIFAFMTLDRMERQKEYIKERLLIKGISLIRTFEAGTRTGMLTMQWGARRIQSMLLETAVQPDVDYIMITSKSGEILAHSDAALVGKRFDAMPDITAVQGDTLLVSHRRRQMKGRQVFEVFKRFTPLTIGFRNRHKPMHGMGRGYREGEPGKNEGVAREFRREGGSSMACPEASSLEPDFSGMTEHYIFAGLSMTRASLAQDRLLKQTIGRGFLFFLVGCIGMIGLFAFQAYRSAKASLTSVQAFSDNVVQNMPAGLVAIDQDHRITSMNRAAKEIFGQVPEKPFPQMIQLIAEMETLGKPVSREVTLRKGTSQKGTSQKGTSRKGTHRELRLDMTASPLLDNEGVVLGFLFLFRDLTQLRELKKEVETTRHLAAIGKLAGGVAHEIRNPLSSIKGFATYFGKRYANNSQDRETAQIMVQEVERINRSITQLLEFAKPMAVENRVVRLDDLISHSLKLVKHDLDKKAIDASVNIQTDKTWFRTDPDRMNQILLNLYMNAINAMDDGGQLTVDLLALPDGNGLEIHVTDNGSGIDKDHLDEVFDPYFTTRPEGTGLGLSIVHRIVENLKGDIRVESDGEKGTRFMIRLPGIAQENPWGEDKI